MRIPSSRGGGGARGRRGGGGCAGKKAEATPCCTKVGLKRGPWTADEDELLADYIKREGEGRWPTLPKKAGLLRCGKSCRLRWMNYLRPSIKRGHITPDEEDLILRLHRLLGNRWSLIAGRIPGRTDNEIKNYWNTHLSKKLISQGIDPKTHKPFTHNPSIDNNIDSSSEAVHSSLSNTYYAPLASQSPIAVDGNVDSHQHYADEDGAKKETGNCDDDQGMISQEDGEEMNNCCPDDGFSSFLNSLINDEMFNNQHQDQQEQIKSAQQLPNLNQMIPPR